MLLRSNIKNILKSGTLGCVFVLMPINNGQTTEANMDINNNRYNYTYTSSNNNNLKDINNISSQNIENVNSINKIHNSPANNKVTISKEEIDKFLENYKKNPVLSSINACLQISSLIIKKEPTLYDNYFLTNIDYYFNNKNIALGMENIMEYCSVLQDYEENNAPLIIAIIFNVIDEYIKSKKILDDEKIDKITNKILSSIKDKILKSIEEREEYIKTNNIKYQKELDNISNVLNNNLAKIQK